MEDAGLIIVMFYRLWWMGYGGCWVDYCYVLKAVVDWEWKMLR